MKTTASAIAISMATLALTGVAGHVSAKDCSHRKEKEHKHEERVRSHDCARGTEHKHKEEAHVHSGECSHGDEISVRTDGVSLKNAGIETTRPRVRDVGSEIALPGRFELTPEARVCVGSPAGGRLEIKAKSLSRVNKGEILFTVTSPDISAKKKEIEILEKRLAVYSGIKTKNANLENEIAIKKAELDAMVFGAEETNGTFAVRAPRSGIVEELLVRNGTWIERGASVIQLANLESLRFKALSTAEEAVRLKEAQTARIGDIEGALRIGPGDESGIVPVYVVFGKDVPKLSGEKATAICSVGKSGEKTLCVPDGAIVRIGLKKYVFTRESENDTKFVAVEVEPGEKAAGWTDVMGLPSPYCEVVSAGAYELKIAATADANRKPSGHFHADGTFHEGDHH